MSAYHCGELLRLAGIAFWQLPRINIFQYLRLPLALSNVDTSGLGYIIWSYCCDGKGFAG